MQHRLFMWQRLFIAAVALVLLPAPVAAQTEDEAPDSATPFVDTLDVEIVNIDVWVTDRQGEPVTGLTRDDFLVFRDRQPVEIANFYAVEGGRERDEGAEEPAGLEPPPAARLEPLEMAPEHRLWMIVYLDNYNLDPIERNRILPALEQFLTRTLAVGGGQAMLVTYNRSLKVRQPFTDSVDLLVSALEELRKEAGYASIRRRDLMSTLRRIDEARGPNQALIYARQYAEEQMNGVNFTTDALQRLIDTLAGLPGRKALVHVSSGVPMVAGEEVFHAVDVKFNVSEAYGEIPRHDTSKRFEEVNRTANANRVSFYTVDAGGLRGLEFGNAEYGGFVDPHMRRTLDSVVPENLQSPLRLMALETGGQAILNQNEVLPALRKAAEDFRSFYSLGISSSGSDSGRYYEIEVKLRERARGLKVRHRSGYRSKSTDTRVRESLRSALLYSHQANPLEVEVVWGRAEPSGDRGHYLLPIQLRIPLKDVVLLPLGDGRHEARLQLFVGAADEDGGVSELDTAPLGVRLAEEHVAAARGEALLHTHKLLLSPGRKIVGVAILDRFGNESSIVTRALQVGPDPDSG